jgi:hypothetical protein
LLLIASARWREALEKMDEPEKEIEWWIVVDCLSIGTHSV